MSKNLLGKGDILVLRDTSVRGIWITPNEIRETVACVGEVAYTLYSVYRTYPFQESDELTDEAVGIALGWPAKKVQKYRLLLESNNLFLTTRYGTKTDGITKVFVGAETVALFNAGLPADILNPKALHKLKKEFNVTTSQELVQQANAMCLAYEQDPRKYQ